MSTFPRDASRTPDDFDDEATGTVDRPPPRAETEPPANPSGPEPAGHAWYLAQAGAQFGPFTTAQLKTKLAAGEFSPEATVWREGLSEWEEWGWIPELRVMAQAPRPRSQPTLSPLEQAASTEMPETAQGRRQGISPWYAMIGAVFFGLGVSFVVLKLVVGGREETANAVRPGLSWELSVQGSLGRDQLRSVLGERIGQAGDECWRQALASSTRDAPSSASVQATLRIDPTGRVSQADSAGEAPGYPSLAHCILGRTRGWRLPSAAGPSTVKVSIGLRKE